eukprot:scaffold148831_cov22-Tisochrysis_lutea.AAC.1
MSLSKLLASQLLGKAVALMFQISLNAFPLSCQQQPAPRWSSKVTLNSGPWCGSIHSADKASWGA